MPKLIADPLSGQRRGRPLGGILVGAVVLIGLTAVGILPRLEQRAARAAMQPEAHGARRVRVAIVTPGPATSELVLPATSQPLRSTQLFPKATGFLRRNRVEIGDRVKAGDVLADIDVKEADQDLVLARARLEEAQANIGIAKGTAERNAKLAETGAVSRQLADDARAQANSAVAGLKTREAELARLYRVQAYQTVTSPFEGVVVRRGYDPGAFVGPSSAGAVPLFEIAQTNRLRVVIDIPQSFAGGVAVGLDASVYNPQTPQLVEAGKVVRTAGVLDPGTRTLHAEIELPGGGSVLPGAFVYVRLTIPKPAPTLSVPAAALVVRKEGTLVATVQDDRVKLSKVILGRDDGKSLEILSGLTAGARVILNVPDDLDDGALVQVASPDTKPNDP